MKLYSRDYLLAELRSMISYYRSQSDIAKELGVSRAFVSDIFRGVKPPSGKVLDLLGYESVIAYRKVKQP